ncbi:MAG: hypothetical protein WB507_02110 [Solirubrobacterales bacterium]
MNGEAGEQGIDRGASLAEPAETHRGDKIDRARLAPEEGGEAGVGLAQGQVKGCGLKGPAPVLARDISLGGRGGEEVGLTEQAGELGETAGTAEAGRRTGALLGEMVDRVIGDVLTDPLLAAAAQLDYRRQAFELTDRELEPLKLTGLDLQRQLGDPVIGGDGTSLGEGG